MPLYFNSFSNEILRLEICRKRGGVYLRQKNGVKFPDNEEKRIHCFKVGTLFPIYNMCIPVAESFVKNSPLFLFIAKGGI